MSEDHAPELKEAICRHYDESLTITVHDLADIYDLPVEDIKRIVLEY